MTLIDISPVIDAATNVWPGDTPFVRTINSDMNAGSNLTLSDMRVSLHVGAHADAPNHYIVDGDDISIRRLDLYLGRCIVVEVDVARGERIMPDHVADKIETQGSGRKFINKGYDGRKGGDAVYLVE